MDRSLTVADGSSHAENRNSTSEASFPRVVSILSTGCSQPLTVARTQPYNDHLIGNSRHDGRAGTIRPVKNRSNDDARSDWQVLDQDAACPLHGRSGDCLSRCDRGLRSKRARRAAVKAGYPKLPGGVTRVPKGLAKAHRFDVAKFFEAHFPRPECRAALPRRLVRVR